MNGGSGLEGSLVSVRPRLLFLVTEDWYFWSHRLDLARAARCAGMDVSVATRVRDHGESIEAEGFKLFPLRFLRREGTGFLDAASVVELIGLYRRERPHLVHHVAMKPILYGSLAARAARIPVVVNAFAGLGHAFVANDRRSQVRRVLLIPALRGALALRHSRVIFQNSDDSNELISLGIVREPQTVIIRGAGVDVSRFVPLPEAKGEPTVILASRMLWNKGVGEFVDAARLLRRRGSKAKCVLVGRVDKSNPSGISERQLCLWQEEGIVEWWGHREDMAAVFACSHIVTLPTYYGEGIPKVLLEAASCARPIVATDTRGCRDVVRNGENGFLVPQRDARALADALELLVTDHVLRQRMGERGREIAVAEFSGERVARETLLVYHNLLGDAGLMPSQEMV